MRRRVRQWIVRVALAQLLAHVAVVYVFAQGSVDSYRIDDLTRRVQNVEGQADRVQALAIDVGVLKSEMTEVKWLSRGVTASVIGLLVASALGLRRHQAEQDPE